MLSISATPAAANIGKIAEARGKSDVVRRARVTPGAPQTPIEQMDTVRTGAGRVKIVFVDNSTVNITEQSKLVIDTFVYDPNPKKGRMALKFAQGTVRFKTGSGVSKSNINLRTPTATIAVRGTDFVSTVDEFGKSLIILLPEEDGSVGEITVSNGAGIVILNRAFQATTVATYDTQPTKPVILNVSIDMIDNMMIVSPPEEIKEGNQEQDSRANLLDLTELDIDYLKNDDLEQSDLNIDGLDTGTFDSNKFEDFLSDSLTSTSDQKEGVSIEGTSFGYNDDTQILTIITGESIRLTRSVNNVTDIIVPKTQGTIININDSGKSQLVTINSGGSVIIVNQKN